MHWVRFGEERTVYWVRYGEERVQCTGLAMEKIVYCVQG